MKHFFFTNWQGGVVKNPGPRPPMFRPPQNLIMFIVFHRFSNENLVYIGFLYGKRRFVFGFRSKSDFALSLSVEGKNNWILLMRATGALRFWCYYDVWFCCDFLCHSACCDFGSTLEKRPKRKYQKAMLTPLRLSVFSKSLNTTFFKLWLTRSRICSSFASGPMKGHTENMKCGCRPKPIVSFGMTGQNWFPNAKFTK